MVAALAISGDLGFNPITDTLTNEKGEQVKLDEPSGWELPLKGFDVEDAGYLAPAEDGSDVIVNVNPDSKKITTFKEFAPWNGENIMGAKLLIKVKGKMYY